MPFWVRLCQKSHPFGVVSGAFSPVFRSFFAERTQLVFFTTVSQRNIYAVFRWVRSSKKHFYRESHPNRVVAAPAPSRFRSWLRAPSSPPTSSSNICQSRVGRDATASCLGRRTASYTTPALSKNWRDYTLPGSPCPARISISDTCPPLAGPNTRRKPGLTTRRTPAATTDLLPIQRK